MQITFQNGEIIDCEGVYSSSCFYQGTSREMYTFLFQPDTDLNMLSELFTPENCEKILIQTDDGGKFVHENFTIRYGLGCSTKEYATGELQSSMNVSSIGTDDDPQKVFLSWVKMVQTTLAERRIMEQQNVLDAILVSQLKS